MGRREQKRYDTVAVEMVKIIKFPSVNNKLVIADPTDDERNEIDQFIHDTNSSAVVVDCIDMSDFSGDDVWYDYQFDNEQDLMMFLLRWQS